LSASLARGGLKKDPYVWLNGARPGNTCILGMGLHSWTAIPTPKLEYFGKITNLK